MTDYKKIRNFVIISHVDHGKSTLADRFLEITNTVHKDKMRSQYLDMMDLEQERGITIKLQPCRMSWKALNSEKTESEFILNLIDTPGHIDFSYEVSRALAAVEGAILLVDAVKGIQAQTLANLELARKQNLTIIPAINKIDIPNAPVEKTKQELSKILDIDANDIFEISAKKGINIENLLKAVIEKVPYPKNADGYSEKCQALIFDSKYDSYKGVIAYIRVFNGKIKKGDKIYLIRGKIQGEAKEIGVFKPLMVPEQELNFGEIGYIATGIKDPEKVRIGDTIISYSLTDIDKEEKALKGYQEPKPKVFVSVYPEDSKDFGLLKKSLDQLKLNDPSFYFEPERKEIFGQGFRCGFLGSLHLEIITERLRREFKINLIVFSPSVVYKARDKNNKEIFIFSTTDWDNVENKEIEEPWIKLEILSPTDYLGSIMELLKNIDNKYVDTKYLGKEKILLKYEIPLREIIIGFYDDLMEKTQGYASINYEFLEYRKANLVKVDILVAGEKHRAFSRIIPAQKAEKEARKLVKKLKDVLPSHQFSVAIQAVIGGKIIARETKKAFRKDVVAGLYGGDYSRKRKQLEKQKKGKKKLKQTGRINIPSKVFLQVLSSK
ncbi:MAG: translation elongation factor 4 [Patescibacteria group bacterium]|nr:translation elongation factor 4 [Patescibacteria group bacterium]